jgi:hypothetical protein
MKKLIFVGPFLAVLLVVAACAWFQGGSATITGTQQTVTVLGPNGEVIAVNVQNQTACVTDSNFKSLPFLLPNIECDTACASWAEAGKAEVQLTCRVKGTSDTFPLVLYAQSGMGEARKKMSKPR